MAHRREFARQLLAALAMCSLLGTTSSSQQSPPSVNPRQQPATPSDRGQGRRPDKGTIRTVTDLVLIDAQVTDRAGKPLKGLKTEQFTVLEDDKPQKIATFDYYDIEAIEAAAAELGLKTMRLPSGAGHDAQMMAKIGPIGMIFVPSVDGISHSPKEFTRWQDCANGANVLLQTILLIDRAAA